MFQRTPSKGFGSALGKKNYILIPVLFLISTPPAKAGVMGQCKDWISSLEKQPKKLAAPVHPSTNRDYQKYMRARLARPAVMPPAAPLERTTSDEELRFSFYFWWYPGNVFGPLMIPKNPELAGHLLAGERLADHMIPTPEERATEAAARAEQPLIAEEKAEPVLPTPAPGRSGAHSEARDDHLDTSPTKDTAPPNSTSAGDAGASYSGDSGPPPGGGGGQP